jgi:O-antigen/teichoic acid export membrane protein
MRDASLLIDRLPVALRGRVHRLRQRAVGPGFARNVAVMLAGTVAGQAISLLLSPVLTRLFTPAEFGNFSVYSSALTVCAVLASFSLEVAIPISLEEAECANLVALCGLSLLAVTGLVGVFIWLIPTAALQAMAVGSLAAYRYLLPIGLLCLGSYYIMVAVATRAGAFREIARTRLSQGLSGPLTQVVLGLLGAGTPGLVIGFVIGQSSGTLLLLSRFVVGRADWLRAVSWRGIAAAGWRYRNFPLYASWSRLLDVAGGGLVLFVLFSSCYGPAVAGFMFLSERIVMRPLLLVSTSLLQVFTGEAGRAVSEDPAQLRRRFYQVVPHQFLFAAAWVLAVNLVAGWAFPLLFGPVWASATPYLHALSVSYLIYVVLHPVSGTLQLLERQAIAAAWQAGRMVLVVASVLLPWRAGMSAVGAMWISSLVQAACCIALLGIMAVLIERLPKSGVRQPTAGSA